jgi:hypothetical protein
VCNAKSTHYLIKFCVGARHKPLDSVTNFHGFTSLPILGACFVVDDDVVVIVAPENHEQLASTCPNVPSPFASFLGDLATSFAKTSSSFCTDGFRFDKMRTPLVREF